MFEQFPTETGWSGNNANFPPQSLTTHSPGPPGWRWMRRGITSFAVRTPYSLSPVCSHNTFPSTETFGYFSDDNIRVPKDYLDERNLTSVYTMNGSEGIVSLSVYHSLHCLVSTLMRIAWPSLHTSGIRELTVDTGTEKGEAYVVQRALSRRQVRGGHGARGETRR